MFPYRCVHHHHHHGLIQLELCAFTKMFDQNEVFEIVIVYDCMCCFKKAPFFTVYRMSIFFCQKKTQYLDLYASLPSNARVKIYEMSSGTMHSPNSDTNYAYSQEMFFYANITIGLLQNAIRHNMHVRLFQYKKYHVIKSH